MGCTDKIAIWSLSGIMAGFLMGLSMATLFFKVNELECKIDKLELKSYTYDSKDAKPLPQASYDTETKYQNFVGLDSRPPEVVQDFTPPKEEQK